jgi:hypothetical protein
MAAGRAAARVPDTFGGRIWFGYYLVDWDELFQHGASPSLVPRALVPRALAPYLFGYRTTGGVTPIAADRAAVKYWDALAVRDKARCNDFTAHFRVRVEAGVWWPGGF